MGKTPRLQKWGHPPVPVSEEELAEARDLQARIENAVNERFTTQTEGEESAILSEDVKPAEKPVEDFTGEEGRKRLLKTLGDRLKGVAPKEK